MSKCAVSLSHTVHILLTLVSTTLVVVSIHNLSSKLVSHALTATLACESDKVLHRDALLALGANFGRNLECSTTNTAALYLHLRSNIVESLLPNFESGLLLLGHLLLYGIKGLVEDFV